MSNEMAGLSPPRRAHFVPHFEHTIAVTDGEPEVLTV
jgi:methionine aminopeptidase